MFTIDSSIACLEKKQTTIIKVLLQRQYLTTNHWVFQEKLFLSQVLCLLLDDSLSLGDSFIYLIPIETEATFPPRSLL